MKKKQRKEGMSDVALRAFGLAIDKAYGNWGYLIARSFVAGIFIGLGATIGFAIIVALIGYVLGALEVVPVIGEFFSDLNQFIDTAASLR